MAAARPACGCASRAIPPTVDPRFLVDEAKLDRLAEVIDGHWPDEIASTDIQSPALVADVERARAALLEALELPELDTSPFWDRCVKPFDPTHFLDYR